jgi:hypothetical protein
LRVNFSNAIAAPLVKGTASFAVHRFGLPGTIKLFARGMLHRRCAVPIVISDAPQFERLVELFSR